MGRSKRPRARKKSPRWVCRRGGLDLDRAWLPRQKSNRRTSKAKARPQDGGGRRPGGSGDREPELGRVRGGLPAGSVGPWVRRLGGWGCIDWRPFESIDWWASIDRAPNRAERRKLNERGWTSAGVGHLNTHAFEGSRHAGAAAAAYPWTPQKASPQAKRNPRSVGRGWIGSWLFVDG